MTQLNTSMVLRTDSARNGGLSGNYRVDNNDILFFANELTHYDPREFEVIKNGLSFLDIFQCNSSIDPGQESYSWEIYDAYGQSKAITKNAKDIPFVGATGKQFTSKFINIGIAIEYTAQDLLASAVAKKEITARLRKQAMRSNFELMNKICFYGHADLDINGLFSDKNLTNKKAVVAVKGKTAWKEKTNEEVFKDLIDSYNDCMEATNNNIPPNTLLISSPAYNEIATRIFNSFNGTTILRQIESMTNVKVIRTPELNKAFSGDTDGFIYFQNNDSYVEQLIPTFFETTEPHRHYNTYNIGCFSRYGGLVIRQPKMFAIRYGI
jgi:hypothetical protein